MANFFKNISFLSTIIYKSLEHSNKYLVMVSHISSSRNIFFALKITNMKTLIFYFAAVRCPHQPTAYSRYLPLIFFSTKTLRIVKSQQQTLSFERFLQKTFFLKVNIELRGIKNKFFIKNKVIFYNVYR